MIFVLTFAFAVNVLVANAQIRDVLTRMDDFNKGLQSLKADVTMVKYDVVLKDSDIYAGNTMYLPKSKTQSDRAIKLSWTKPAVEQMLVRGDHYELYRARANQLIRGKVQNVKKGGAGAVSVLSFLSMSKVQMKQNYDIVYLGDEKLSTGDLTFHLQLTPKKVTDHKSVELWVDKDGMPLQVKTTALNNDTTTVLLTNAKVNKTLNGEDFALQYPKDVAIIEK
jgi:outer membrane lipoprotein-sorting protein